MFIIDIQSLISREKGMQENTELRETAKLRLMCLPCLNIYNQGHSFRRAFSIRGPMTIEDWPDLRYEQVQLRKI